ncbi:Lrp/AsnC family transcriptional regulator [Ureibacillus thermosphaericus]|nr:Lrp/AsnC family transcriptional regulator [Ureibacillus thermosphaericus]
MQISSIQCIVEATVKNGDYKSFKNFIEGLPNVEFCYRISGKACFMLKLQFESFSKVEEFINDVSPYATNVNHFIFSKVQTMMKFRE